MLKRVPASALATAVALCATCVEGAGKLADHEGSFLLVLGIWALPRPNPSFPRRFFSHRGRLKNELHRQVGCQAPHLAVLFFFSGASMREKAPGKLGFCRGLDLSTGSIRRGCTKAQWLLIERQAGLKRSESEVFMTSALSTSLFAVKCDSAACRQRDSKGTERWRGG